MVHERDREYDSTKHGSIKRIPSGGKMECFQKVHPLLVYKQVMWRMRTANCQAELPLQPAPYIAPSNDFYGCAVLSHCCKVCICTSTVPSRQLVVQNEFSNENFSLVTLFVLRFHYKEIDRVRGKAGYISLSRVLFWWIKLLIICNICFTMWVGLHGLPPVILQNIQMGAVCVPLNDTI